MRGTPRCGDTPAVDDEALASLRRTWKPSGTKQKRPAPRGSGRHITELSAAVLLSRGLEVRLGQLGLHFYSLAPAGARFFFLAQCFAHVTQVQQRFRKLRLLLQGLLVILRGVLHFGALLGDQAGVVEQLGAALTQIQQLLMQRERLVVILLRQ